MSVLGASWKEQCWGVLLKQQPSESSVSVVAAAQDPDSQLASRTAPELQSKARTQGIPIYKRQCKHTFCCPSRKKRNRKNS